MHQKLTTNFFNVDTKNVSKSLSERLTMFTLEVREGGTLICDMVDVCESNNIEGYLLAIDIGKAFDSLDHKFPAVLKKWFW